MATTNTPRRTPPRDDTQGTKTTHGFVPHLAMRTGEGVDFWAPVKLVLAEVPAQVYEAPLKQTIRFAPMVREGVYVFALPGGGEILDAAEPPQVKEQE